jgi:hypothetical protein
MGQRSAKQVVNGGEVTTIPHGVRDGQDEPDRPI